MSDDTGYPPIEFAMQCDDCGERFVFTPSIGTNTPKCPKCNGVRFTVNSIPKKERRAD